MCQSVHPNPRYPSQEGHGGFHIAIIQFLFNKGEVLHLIKVNINSPTTSNQAVFVLLKVPITSRPFKIHIFRILAQTNRVL